MEALGTWSFLEILFNSCLGTAWLNDLWMFDIETQRWECIQESSDPVADEAANSRIVLFLHEDLDTSVLCTTTNLFSLETLTEAGG